MEWSIGGKAMPDLAFLIGPEYTAQHAKSNGIMSAFVEPLKAQNDAAGGDRRRTTRREDVGGAAGPEDRIGAGGPDARRRSQVHRPGGGRDGRHPPVVR